MRVARCLRTALARSRGDERGAILIVATAGIVLALIAAALAVDLGRLAQEKRNDQKVADMAALDAVRDLANATTRAQASATRNRFPYSAPGHTLDVRVGKRNADGSFQVTALAEANAVEVTVASPVKYAFVGGEKTVRVRAVAAAEAQSGFRIGSSLGTLESSQAKLLDLIVGQMICGTGATCPTATANLGLVGWQGLNNANITLAAVQDELGRLGYSVGTTGELLNSSLTVSDLFRATANALTNQGDLATAALFTRSGGLIAKATNTTRVKLGDFVSIAQGADDTALKSAFMVQDLVVGSAEAANGTNFVDVPNIGITVPGALSTSLRLSVIEGMKTVFGPTGTTATTGQVNLTLSPDLNLPVTIPGLLNPKVTNRLPITLTAAGATGTLSAINCSTPQGITVGVDPKAFSASSSATLRLSSEVLGAQVPLLDIPTRGTAPSTIGGHQDLSFAFPSEFSPPAGSKHVGSEPLGLQGLMSWSQSGPVTVLGALPVSEATAVNTVLDALGPFVGSLDSTVLTRLLRAMGLTVGSADVAALPIQLPDGTSGLNCGIPVLKD